MEISAIVTVSIPYSLVVMNNLTFMAAWLYAKCWLCRRESVTPLTLILMMEIGSENGM